MIKLGIGTTGRCNMNCRHCYSRQYNNFSLSLTDIKRIANSIEIESVNFGTGENILNGEFLQIVKYLHERNIDLSLTANGYSILNMSDDFIKMFHDVDFSLEFPTRELQNGYRGHNSWEMVCAGMKRCKALGIPFSIATVLMRSNSEHIVEFYDLIKEYDCFLRINIIKCNSSNKDENLMNELSYDLFWQSIKNIFKKFKLVSCSEPILKAALKLNSGIGVPCGKSSIRIQPDGSLLPCVYWGYSEQRIEDLEQNGEKVLLSPEFIASQIVPDACRGCEYVTLCGGGCASRRKLDKGLNNPDPFCPMARGEKFPEITYTLNKNQVDLIHSSYLCTIILSN